MTHIPPREALLPMLARLREQITALHPAAAEDAELLLATVEGETDALEQLRCVARAALEAETFAAAVDARIYDLKARKARFEARSNVCRTTLRDALETLGMKRLEDAEFTASVGAGPTSVVITDLDALPERFKRIKVEADKIAISRVLKAGERIAGAELSNGGQPVLTIRRILHLKHSWRATAPRRNLKLMPRRARY